MVRQISQTRRHAIGLVSQTSFKRLNKLRSSQVGACTGPKRKVRIVQNSWPQNGSRRQFIVRDKKRDFKFQAKDEACCEEWAEAIDACIQDSEGFLLEKVAPPNEKYWKVNEK